MPRGPLIVPKVRCGCMFARVETGNNNNKFDANPSHRGHASADA